MRNCDLCGESFQTTNGLAKHITNQHDISKKDYYDKFDGKVSSICLCGKEKKFRNLGEGYRTFCSPRCRSSNIAPTSSWTGKKQPQSMIDKRRNTHIEKYGVACGLLVRKSKVESYKGFVCRSKYEKAFIDFADQFGFTIEVPCRIPYEHDGRSRFFYPDFYIRELDLIVEIKSDWTWNLQLELNISKICASLDQGYRIIFIDEEDGLTETSRWEELNEHLCSV